MSTGRASAERRARSTERSDRGTPLGTAVVQKDRPETDYYLIRFPHQIVDATGIEEGDSLEQFYDPDSGELRIPVDE